MKKLFSLLMVVFSVSSFAQIMTINVDEDTWAVCPTDLVDVNVSRTSPSNNSISLNGTSSYFEIPFSANTSFGNANFTVEFWVKSNQSAPLTVLASSQSVVGVGWAVLMDLNGFVTFAALDATGTANSMSGALSSVNDGNWHHVAVSWNRGTTDATMFIDGGFEVSQSFPLGDITSNASTILGYGINPLNGTALYTNAEFDEFRMWSEARSIGDVQLVMSTHLNPGSFPTLAQNFDFNELTATSGWLDCAAGLVAPFSGTSPAINVSGGPSMTFNFAFTWNAVNTGLTQNGPNFQETFDKNEIIVVSTGYCKYETSDSVLVTALDCDTLPDPRDVAAVFMPSAFTPNGDTKNDYYIVKANAISYFEMQIYNRLGNILFYSKDINTGWDGTFDDKTCYEGVYVAKIIYRDLEGIEFIKYQQFSLMR